MHGSCSGCCCGPSTPHQLGELCHLDQVGQLGQLSQVSQLAQLPQPGQLVHLGQIGQRRQSLRYITQTLPEFALYNANSAGPRKCIRKAR